MTMATVPTTKKVPFTIDNILSNNDGHTGRTRETNFPSKVADFYPIKSSSLSSPHHQAHPLQHNFSPSTPFHHPTLAHHQHLIYTHHYHQQSSHVFKGFSDDLMIHEEKKQPDMVPNPSDIEMKNHLRNTLTHNNSSEYEMNGNGSSLIAGSDPYSLRLHPQLMNPQDSRFMSMKQDSHPSSSSHSLSLSPCSSQSPSSLHQVHPSVLGISGPPGSGVTFSWVSPPKCLPRKRTVFSRFQRNELERKFEAQKYISKTERLKFARELGLKDSQVKVWFINRRTKWRNDREKRVRKQHASSQQVS